MNKNYKLKLTAMKENHRIQRMYEKMTQHRNVLIN